MDCTISTQLQRMAGGSGPLRLTAKAILGRDSGHYVASCG